MSDESTTPDLVERWRRTIEAGLRRDLDAAMSVYAPDAVWDASLSGVGSFEGVIGNRSFLEDWIGGYDEYEHEHEEAQDIGGVVFAVARVDGRPAGSAVRVQERWAFTSVWTVGMIARVTARNDIAEARAVAERLAEERA